jgi:hypothetical protein
MPLPEAEAVGSWIEKPLKQQSRLVFDGIARGEPILISSCDAVFSVFFSVYALPFCDVFSFYHLAWCLLSMSERISWVSLEKSVGQAFLLPSSRGQSSD